MKKLFVLMVAAMAVISASAQMRTSRTFTKTKSNTEWILRVSPSFNSITGIDGYNSKVGFDWDVAFNKSFGQSPLYWGMELGIGTRGCGWDVDEEYEEWYGEDLDDGMTTYNVKWSPFTIGYKYAVTEDFKLDPHVGAYALYDFASSNDYEFENMYDVGLQAGVGIWYKRVNLDFMYQFGFINAGEDAGKTGNFLIRVGYRF